MNGRRHLHRLRAARAASQQRAQAYRSTLTEERRLARAERLRAYAASTLDVRDAADLLLAADAVERGGEP